MTMAPRTAYRQPQAGGQGFARTKKVFGGPAITLVAGDVALNAQTAIARVPKGFILQSIGGTVGDLDTGAALMVALGDAGNNARFFAANAIGQAGGAMPALVAGSVGYEFPDDTDILLTATVAAAGLGPTPTINLLLEGYMK
ncbi:MULTISPECIES: hypothetical protein [Bradyrhizobium]|uniref:hypothetical protein n=2 Tax=Nitrobacteraceae TaxID=41294 RepID=UPI000576F772|nr:MULTISPECIES: hypothetical protein [Bradyrhizobium]MBR0802837.1 hypothetical protein [Bradyrhizobium japonicum]MBR0941784.1 hypothetical protein [Bradyrhizobium liaoningense]MDI2076053.1 hypothetical protein [Bradyrhizobium sp. Mp27]